MAPCAICHRWLSTTELRFDDGKMACALCRPSAFTRVDCIKCDEHEAEWCEPCVETAIKESSDLEALE